MQEVLSTEILDLGANRRGELTESYLTSMGTFLTMALEKLFAGAGGSMKAPRAPFSTSAASNAGSRGPRATRRRSTTNWRRPCSTTAYAAWVWTIWAATRNGTT